MNGRLPDGAAPARIQEWLNELYTAFGVLTRLPLPASAAREGEAGGIAKALRLSPVVGAFVGAMTGSFYWLGLSLGLSPLLAALLAISVGAILTGGLHEDALSDMVDGYSGGRTRARKMEIMSDGRIGAHGALTLMIALLLRVGAIAQLSSPVRVMAALIAAGALSRAVMLTAMATLPYAKETGLAFGAGRPGGGHVLVALGLGFVISVLVMPFGAAFGAALAAGGGAAIVSLSAMRQIGGQTGDILGAVQQISEICVLLLLASVLAG